jgi:DNA replication protein DnaC
MDAAGFVNDNITARIVSYEEVSEKDAQRDGRHAGRRTRRVVLTEREEKYSVAIASNESFGGRTKTFTDPRLCAAIVDRLTFNGTVIETATDSHRLATTRARIEEPAKAS